MRRALWSQAGDRPGMRPCLSALRFDAPEQLNQPLPFDVMAISEFIGREIKAGRLKVKRKGGDKKVTYHDPSKLAVTAECSRSPRCARSTRRRFA
jgi:Fe-S oxidoreductase